MAVLAHLEPCKVFQFFEEICGIPHGSGNIEKISEYLVDFATKRNLEVIRDEIKNVIIIKEATAGYEEEPPVILQGHMDMVAVHKPELSIDMAKEPLKLAVDGDRVYAEGTSLGGDDGIAVAYGLALLDADNLEHPRLEVVITVDEETGMEGARGIDLSMLKGNRLLNLDSEEEGIFLTSCAGGARVSCELDVKVTEIVGEQYRVVIGGLQGGHSGVEIHTQRGNSNQLMARLLWDLLPTDPGLIQCEGGMADNAIARETTAVLVVPEDKKELLYQIRDRFAEEVGRELALKDPGFYLRICPLSDEEMQNDGRERRKNISTDKISCISGAPLQKLSALLAGLPNGVQAMSLDIPGLVETSLNLGILQISKEGLRATYAVRSSVESCKEALLKRMEAIVALAGGRYICSGSYPGWAYRAESPLRDKMISLYEDMYGEKPKVEAIHAGLECGLLAGKIRDLDCVSFGPNMYNIHTTEEYLSISSVQRVWEYLVRLLAMKE